MKKTLIRFEPFLGGYMFLNEGNYYLIESEDILDVLSDEGCCQIVRHENNPQGAYSMPLKVQIQATDICNMRCITCAVARDGFITKNNLSLFEMLTLLEKLSQWGILNIEWSGGEPFLRKDFLDIVGYASDIGFGQNILTNGTLFSEKNINSIKDNFFRIQFSLDGVGDLFNHIVGVNLWNTFVKSISVAIEAEVPNMIAATVLQESNVSHLSDIINFCINIGIKKLRISMQVPIGRSKGLGWIEYSKTIDQFRNQWTYLKSVAVDGGLEINSFLEKEVCDDENVNDVGQIISPGGYSFIYITSNGEIFPFPFLTSPDLLLGSIKNDNLKEIWLNSTVLKQLRSYNYQNTGCGGCRLECSFAERALVYAFSGRMDAPALSHEECINRRG